MRRIALAPLLAVAGCNWVFGLEPAVPIDAPPPDQEVFPRTKLVWAIATVDGKLETNGFDPTVEYRPIGSEPLHPQVPSIQVDDGSGLVDATYDVLDGSFETPKGPHRIVYTLPGESVPHEVQWEITEATLVVPRTTRADSPLPPDNSGYVITPTGLNVSLSAPIAYTSGVFTAADTIPSEDLGQGTVTYRYTAHARPLAGPIGTPLAAQRDWVVIADLVARTSDQSSVDGWAIARCDLVANMMTPCAADEWVTTERTLSTIGCPGPSCLPAGNAGDTTQRLVNGLKGLGATISYKFAYGVSPSTEIAGFIPGGPPTYLDEPLMLPFAMSTQIDSSVTLADPTPALGLPPVVFARVAYTRVVNGVTLASAIQTVTNDLTNKVEYPAPLATKITLADIGLGEDQADGVPFPATSDPITLALEVEQQSGVVAHDYVITLYEIVGTALKPVRHYHTITPNVKIDGALLVPSRTYVLGITARSGYDNASKGDYQKAKFPFGTATTFSRTFVVQ